MDHTALLFAASVRDLAERLRNTDWERESQEAPYEQFLAEGGFIAKQFRERWFDEHPVSGYVTQAYGLIRNVALQIETLQ